MPLPHRGAGQQHHSVIPWRPSYISSVCNKDTSYIRQLRVLDTWNWVNVSKIASRRHFGLVIMGIRGVRWWQGCSSAGAGLARCSWWSGDWPGLIFIQPSYSRAWFITGDWNGHFYENKLQLSDCTLIETDTQLSVIYHLTLDHHNLPRSGSHRWAGKVLRIWYAHIGDGVL